jgi:hypothetical protein
MQTPLMISRKPNGWRNWMEVSGLLVVPAKRVKQAASRDP